MINTGTNLINSGETLLADLELSLQKNSYQEPKAKHIEYWAVKYWTTY